MRAATGPGADEHSPGADEHSPGAEEHSPAIPPFGARRTIGA
jgi:hypothetical protein